MVILALLMRFFKRMGSDGNVRVENAVGLNGICYLKVPAENSGHGKVTLVIQGRTHEYEAVTSGPELATNSPCRVVKVITGSLLEVASLDSKEE